MFSAQESFKVFRAYAYLSFLLAFPSFCFLLFLCCFVCIKPGDQINENMEKRKMLK